MNPTLLVNGRLLATRADPSTPLLHVLRNDFGLQGPRFGCGLGQCGACTVHLDGVAVRSCVVPVSAVGDRPVTTLEGLASADELHPMQAAFLEEQATQCGYCLNGWVMTAASLVRAQPRATEDALREGLSGLKCRCGAQCAMLRAVRRGAAAMEGRG